MRLTFGSESKSLKVISRIVKLYGNGNEFSTALQSLDEQ